MYIYGMYIYSALLKMLSVLKNTDALLHNKSLPFAQYLSTTDDISSFANESGTIYVHQSSIVHFILDLENANLESKLTKYLEPFFNNVEEYVASLIKASKVDMQGVYELHQIKSDLEYTVGAPYIITSVEMETSAIAPWYLSLYYRYIGSRYARFTIRVKEIIPTANKIDVENIKDNIENV